MSYKSLAPTDGEKVESFIASNEGETKAILS